MKVSELITELQLILENVGDIPVLACSDEEGNAVHEVYSAMADGYCGYCGEVFNLTDPDEVHGCDEDIVVCILDVC